MIERRTQVRVLLVSDDVRAIDTISHFMDKEAMRVEISDMTSAHGRLGDSKFEAIVVDFKEGPHALELLKQSRQTASHRAIVVIGILNDSNEMPGAFRAGVSFVLVRPLSSVALARTLRASYPLMVRERRRYFRCPLQTLVYVSIGSGRELMATSANISEGGMAITNAPTLRVGEAVVLRLTLPGSEPVSKLNAEVCWRDEEGRAGMKFVCIPQPVKERLASWLADRLAESPAE